MFRASISTVECCGLTYNILGRVFNETTGDGIYVEPFDTRVAEM